MGHIIDLLTVPWHFKQFNMETAYRLIFFNFSFREVALRISVYYLNLK